MRKFPLLMIPALLCLSFAQTQPANANPQQPPSKTEPKKKRDRRKKQDGAPIQITDPGAILDTSVAHSLKITLPHPTGGNGHGNDDKDFTVDHIECKNNGNPVRHPASGKLPRIWALEVKDIEGAKFVILFASPLRGGHRVDVQEGPGVTCKSVMGALNCANFQPASSTLFYLEKLDLHIEPVSGAGASCTGEVDIQYHPN